MTSDPSLFALAILRTLWRTGLGPGVVILGILVRFPFCVRREFHVEDHDIELPPIERFEAKEQLALFRKSSGGRQLAHIDSSKSNRATSLPRKVRRSA
jgi:hypothetical protein